MQSWKAWLQLGRLVPLITVLTALLVGISRVLGLLQLSLSDSIIITLLGLLAINSLTERLSFLEKIDSKLRISTGEDFLRKRQQLPDLEKDCRTASELLIASVSSITLLHSKQTFFLEKLREGCKVRFLMVNPESDALLIWDQLIDMNVTCTDIKSSLEYLRDFVETGNCEVRFANIFLPFSMIMVDPHKSSAWAIVEFHGYRVKYNRPHLIIRAEQHSVWLEYYRNQVESLWEDSKPWLFNDIGTADKKSD